MSTVAAVLEFYGVTRIEQREMGCFPACIAMLTGIDYDVLPNISPANFVPDADPYSPRLLEDDEQMITVAGETCIDLDHIIAASWANVCRYYLINAGLVLERHSTQPDAAAIRPVNLRRHVVVQLPNGMFIKSDRGYGEYGMPPWATYEEPAFATDEWITVREATPHEREQAEQAVRQQPA